MALKLAYGAKDRIRPNIEAGSIPVGSLILTKDTSEFYVYTSDSVLHQVTKKNQFNSIEEANAWVDKYDCVGQIISIHSGDVWGAYIVEADNDLTLIAGDAVVQTYATHLEFPTIGVSNILYLATDENSGRGYIYHWNEDSGSYEIPADTHDSLEVEVINGGSAST